MEINDLTLNAAPTSDLEIELSDGSKATLASLPVSDAASTLLALKAPLASPALTGTPTAPTAVTATNSTQIATTAFVQQELTAGGSTARSLVVSVRNSSGATMTAGTVVYINGATGNTPTIAKAIATSDTTSAQTIGLVQTSIANNGTGLVVVRGIAGNLDTSALTEGQQLYLSPSVAGTYTTTKQFAPNHLVYIGIVTRAHPNLGTIEVAIQNGYEMDELHNVSAQSPTNGDTLRWNSSTSLWEKSALGTLATQSGTFSGTSSGTNTGDQTITLTGDVTGTGTGSFAATIANNAVTNAKAAQVATQTFKGRNTAATGNVEDLSVATVKTMLAISNVDNTSDANKPVSTAQQTALNLKADLASPALTGNPTAPTPAVTDDDTSIATTAFVQDVQQAMWTQPTAIAITAAGNSNVAAVSAQNRYLTQRINVTAFTGTATVTVQSASAIAGDKRRFIVSMPAGTGNLIELRNLTSGGTLLATVPMDGALARTWLGYSTFDGTNWGAVSFSPLSVDEFVMARTAFRGDYIQSDGATSNRAQIYGPFDAVNNPREWIAGAATLTIAAIVTVPTASALCAIVIYGNTLSPTQNADTYQLRVGIGGGGIASNSLDIGQTNLGGTYRAFVDSTFRTRYSGQTIFLKITLTQGTTNPVVEVNGVNISSGFSLVTNSPPDWLASTLVPTYRLVGFNWPAGPAPIVTPILGTTSAADDAFYLSTGKWPAWVVAGGSMKDAKPTSGTFAKWFGTGTVSGGTSNAVTFDAGSSVLYANGPTLSGVSVVPGSQWVINLTVSGATSGGSVGLSNLSISAEIAVVNGTADYVVTTKSSGTNVIMSCTSTTAATFTINYIRPLGATSLPSVQPINVVDDVSGIGGNQGRILGGTPVTASTNWRISANTWTNGNQQILAGNVLDSTKDVIDLVEQSTTGTPTTTIGSASAGSQYKASSALTAGINPVTLVTRKAASNDVWVNSNSTAVVRTTIVGHRTT